MVVEWLMAAAVAGPAEVAQMAACHEGDAAACWEIGKAMRDAGSSRAEAVLERACEGGEGAACWNLAVVGDGAVSDRRAARACELGHGPACARALGSPRLSLGVRLALAERRCAAGDAEACGLPAAMGLTEEAVEIWQAVPGVQGVPTPGGRIVGRAAAPGSRLVDPGPPTDRVYLDPRAGIRAQVRWTVPEEDLAELTLADPGLRWARSVATSKPPLDELEGTGDAWGERRLVVRGKRVEVFDGDVPLWSVEGASEARLLPGGDLWLGDLWVGLRGAERLPASVDPSGWRDRTVDDVRAEMASMSSGRMVRVAGAVHDAEGQPVEGAVVRFALHDPSPPERPPGPLELDVRTVAEGRFEVALAEETVSFVAIDAAGRRGSSGTVHLAEDRDDLDLRFGPRHAVVRVTDSTGRALPDVPVRSGDLPMRSGPDGTVMVPLGSWSTNQVGVSWTVAPQVQAWVELWSPSDVAGGYLQHPRPSARADLVLPMDRGVLTLRGRAFTMVPVTALDTCGDPLPGLRLGGWETDDTGTATLLWGWTHIRPGSLPDEGVFRMKRVQGATMWPDNHRWTGAGYEVRYPVARVTVRGDPDGRAVWVGPDVRFHVAVGEQAYLTPGRWELWSTAPGLGVSLVDVRPCEVLDVPLPEAREGTRGPLTVRLVDELGFPYASWAVAVEELPEGFPSREGSLLEATTDARGEARFDSVVDGLRSIRRGARDRAGLHVVQADAGPVVELVPRDLPEVPVRFSLHPDGVIIRAAPEDHPLRAGDVVLAIAGLSLRGTSRFTAALLLARRPGRSGCATPRGRSAWCRQTNGGDHPDGNAPLPTASLGVGLARRPRMSCRPAAPCSSTIATRSYGA